MIKKNSVNPSIWSWLALSRILLGLVFLWAFVDKLFGLGFATVAEKAWINGGSPTTGFLSHVEGPFADIFTALAGNAFVDVLFMAGLLGIGLALTLGVAVRLGAMSGIALMIMMWLASFPLENNPLIDDHLVYASLMMVLALALPNQRHGLHAWWQSLSFVKKSPWLW